MVEHVVVESMMNEEGGGLLGWQVGKVLGGGFNSNPGTGVDMRHFFNKLHW